MAGRPRFEPSVEERAQVEALAAYGIPEKAMVLFIKRPRGKAGDLHPIAVNTLRKYFAAELDSGEPKMIAKVADALVKTALDRKHKSHVSAATFILARRGGWKESIGHEHSGELELDLDLRGATDEELAVIEKFLKRKAADAAPRPANDSKAA